MSQLAPSGNVASTEMLIIGGGPAGLATATFFARVNRPFILYDSQLYRNAQSPVAHTIMGFEGSSPADYRSKVRRELEELYGKQGAGLGNGEFRNGKIVSLKKIPEGFEAIDAEGRRIKARKVVLATGIKDVLPDIPGLREAWGTRAIHCIFCHGTETHDQPFAYLLTPNNPFNQHMAPSFLKLWYTLNHSERYILTHGADIETPEGLKASGLGDVIDLLKAKGFRFITSIIESVESTPETLNITFKSGPPLSIPHMLVLPSSIVPSEHASPLLSPEFLQGELIAPFSAIPGPEGKDSGMPMPRMGDSPKTRVAGLFWAGNSGSPMANIALSAAQGMNAAVIAAGELGEEDFQKIKEETRGAQSVSAS